LAPCQHHFSLKSSAVVSTALTVIWVVAEGSVEFHV
jgi:hypothetical protein